MEPEISRRCIVCGASVRSRAGFCPQCGASANPEESNPVPAVELAETQPGHEEKAPEVDLPVEAVMIGETAPVAAHDEAASLPVVTGEDNARDATVMGESAEPSATAPTRRHRVKVAALDAVEGKIAPRVEKLRHASTVVLDEAADDPGLRFVLVAAVLILLSLGLLLLSQILN